MTNKESSAERCKQYHINNKEARNKSSRDYYRRNREAILARHRKNHEENKEEINRKRQKYREDNPEYKEQARRCERRRKLRKYGLTEETYTALLNSQGHVCAICFSENNNGRDWHVDHCHTTRKTRGILCHHCNLMLGNARDNPTTLKEAIKYLGKFNFK